MRLAFAHFEADAVGGGEARETVIAHAHALEVEALELLRVVEIRVHRIGLGGMLAQELELQLVRPPVAV
ncbi:hypothetical protein D3C83_278370 [compost metagenome]